MADLLTKIGAAALLPRDELMNLVRSAPHRYKVYQIPKKAPGQFRIIAQPAKEVKALQYWVMDNVLRRFEIHLAATGYREGRSIADNARAHAHGRFLLKMDFKDFFPSLKARDFRGLLRKNNTTLDKDTVEALCRILFWRPKGTKDLCLSIGAPSSPMLSNILMHDFDQRISAFCFPRRVRYTRYADDLTFSADTSDRLAQAEQAVLKLVGRLKSPALVINHDKTVRVSKKDLRRVTGLVLTNDEKVSLGREQKRRIRAWMHHFATNRLEEDQVVRLAGMFNYILSVEPTFARRLRKKYGADVIRRLRADSQ
jgi:RNA-directed DNA polymerase